MLFTVFTDAHKLGAGQLVVILHCPGVETDGGANTAEVQVDWSFCLQTTEEKSQVTIVNPVCLITKIIVGFHCLCVEWSPTGLCFLSCFLY